MGPLEDGQLAWGLGQTSRGFLWAHHGPPEPKSLAHSPRRGSPCALSNGEGSVENRVLPVRNL